MTSPIWAACSSRARDRVAFLQHVLSSNVESLDLNMAQYCIIPTENGSAVDDAYLCRFEVNGSCLS